MYLQMCTIIKICLLLNMKKIYITYSCVYFTANWYNVHCQLYISLQEWSYPNRYTLVEALAITTTGTSVSPVTIIIKQNLYKNKDKNSDKLELRQQPNWDILRQIRDISIFSGFVYLRKHIFRVFWSLTIILSDMVERC